MSQKSVDGRKAEAKESSKPKLVRDSFTMPKADYALIEALKVKAIEAKRPAKKSELLRAGLYALNGLAGGALVQALEALTPLKAGRPKKEDAMVPKAPAKPEIQVQAKAAAPAKPARKAATGPALKLARKAAATPAARKATAKAAPATRRRAA